MPVRLLKRLLVGLCFAITAGLLAAAVGEAQSPGDDPTRETPPLEGPQRTDCQECHQSVVSHWEESAHGQAVADPIFRESWDEQGNPQECLACHTSGFDPETGTWQEDGITCLVCHSPQTAPHPEVVMPTDPSSRLCGSCHTDTLGEWQESAHGAGDMACIRCHNPHTTSLKVSNIQDLCSVCHTTEGHFYGDTAHSQNGVLCTDCHLKVGTAEPGEGHSLRRHTFTVDLATCNQCHGDEMHIPQADTEAHESNFMWSTLATANNTACPAEATPVVSSEPAEAPSGPVNYMLVAAVGMVFGAAVAPWAEGLYRHITGRGRGLEHDR